MGTCVGKTTKRNALIPGQANKPVSSRYSKLLKDSRRTDAEELDSSSELHASSMPSKLSPNYSSIPNSNHKHNTARRSEYQSGLVGLTNLGNTCFMNSALQCLFNIPPLVDYFMSELYAEEINLNNPLGSRGAVTLAFAKLLKQYWTCETFEEMNPSELYGVISQFAPQFCQGTQEDAHEFLSFLLDMLHEDLNRVKEKPIVEEKDFSGDLLEEYARESWKNHLCRNKSVIVDLFQGQSKSTLKCLKCGYKTHKFEPFLHLSLPIQESKSDISLLDCMKEYSKEEKLTNGERWLCPRCKKRVKVSKKMGVWSLPNVLIVHLKRFGFDKKSHGSKVPKLVNFPVTDLDLSSVTEGIQRDRPVYDLVAVSNHRGNLISGHYYTYAKNRDDNAWYEYNDSNILGLETQNLITESGYLLIFCKTSTRSFRRQTLSRPEAWPCAMRKTQKNSIRTNIQEDQESRKHLDREFEDHQDSAKSRENSDRKCKYFVQQRTDRTRGQFLDSTDTDEEKCNKRREEVRAADFKFLGDQNLNIMQSSSGSYVKSGSQLRGKGI